MQKINSYAIQFTRWKKILVEKYLFIAILCVKISRLNKTLVGGVYSLSVEIKKNKAQMLK